MRAGLPVRLTFLRLTFEISGNQIDGARDYQEDAFLNSFLDNSSDDSKASALVIMADGMGGHAAGNIASNLVVSTFNKTFSGGFGEDADIANSLRVALAKANGALSESIRETPALDGMGCTMVAGIFHAGLCWWVSVGDSHLYLIRDRELHKKNEDHSYGGYLDRMSAKGMDVEPEPGLSRNMLMSAMTGDDIAEIDCPGTPLQLLPGDRVIIASDGLDTLREGTIIQMCAWSSSAKECVDSLLKAVEDAAKPRQDNTTVIVVDVHDKDEGAEPPPPAPPPAAADNTTPSPDDTQPLNLDDIQAALEESGMSEQDHVEYEGSGLNVGRLILAIIVLLSVLGGVGAGVYWYFFGGGAPVIQPEPALEPPKEADSPKELESPAEPARQQQQAPEPQPLENSGSESSSGSDSGSSFTASNGSTSIGTGSSGTSSQGSSAGSTTASSSAEFRDSLNAGGEGPVMIVLSPGSFKMGSTLIDKPDESPKHSVNIDGFAVGKYEVTQAEYQIFASATGRKVPKSAGNDPARDPVVNVSWDDALAYTQWLTEQSGETYRLLSEAEWEYASSAGNNASYWWGFDFEPGRAHCFNCGSGRDSKRPAPVGSFAANPFGLHDTAGNVLEWVYDCYHSNYSGAPVDGSVWQGGHCSKRVTRGGAYNTPNDSLRSQKRAAFSSTRPRKNIGFRVARDL